MTATMPLIITADTPREAVELVRRVLPVTISRSTSITVRQASNSTFEVWA